WKAETHARPSALHPTLTAGLAFELFGEPPKRTVLDDADCAGGAARHLGHLLGAVAPEHAQEDHLGLDCGQPLDARDRRHGVAPELVVEHRLIELERPRRPQDDGTLPPAAAVVERPSPGRRQHPPAERRLVSAKPARTRHDL